MNRVKSRNSASRLLELLSYKGVAPVLPAAMALFVYANSLRGEFVFDDRAVIFQTELLNLKRFVEIFEFTGWRQPLSVSYALNYYLGDLNPLGYHLLSVVLHALNCIIVYYILLEIGADKWPAFAGSILFSVHPIFTGAVSYLAGRSSLLCGTLYFLAILGFLKGWRRSPRLGRWVNFAFAATAAWLSWATKQEAIALPLFLAAYLWVREGVRSSRYLVPLSIVPMLVLFLFKDQITQLSASVSQNAALVAAGYDTVLPFPVYFRTYLTALVAYVLPKFIVPAGLTVDPDIPTVGSWYSPEFVFAVCVLAGLAGGALLLKGTNWLLLRAGIVGILVSPLGAYAVMPLADVIQEHRIYIAGLGFALICAWIVHWSSARLGIRAVSVVFGVVVLVFGIVTIERNRVWANGINLWEDAVHKSPQKSRAHVNLGVEYQARGRLAEALREYEVAARLKPNLYAAEANIGLVHLLQGDVQRARQILERVCDSAPSFVAGWYGLGTVYVALHQPDRALEVLDRALQLKPNFHPALWARGDAFALKGQYAESINSYKAALSVRPDVSSVRLRLGSIYHRAGNLQAAEQEFRSLTTDPKLGADANRNLGVMRSDAGDYDTAISYFQKALGQRPDYPEVHHDLGIVFLRKALPDRAIEELQLALLQKPDFEPAFLTLSEAYVESGKPDRAKKVLVEYLQKFGDRNSTYIQKAQNRLQTLK